MSTVNLLNQCVVERSVRVRQVEGLFDLTPSERSSEAYEVTLKLPDEWSVGLIVGPSGSGKTTVARALWPDALVDTWEWDEAKSVLDGFPSEMGIKEITGVLSSVGFSSPPAWLRPYHALSNGEQFRVHIGRTLAEMPDLAVVDEFTSVVDRDVAKIASAAVQKAVRRRGGKLIAVSCHADIAEWLEPDWTYQPHLNAFHRQRLRRPSIELSVRRVHRSAWEMFRRHHYLDTSIHRSAACFVAFWGEVPVAFTSFVHFPHPKSSRMKRGHRTVCLPDFQGVGIGNALSAYVASVVRGMGYRFMSITSNPAMMATRASSSAWRMVARPNYRGQTMVKAAGSADSWGRGVAGRMRASFEYIGPAIDRKLAADVWGVPA